MGNSYRFAVDVFRIVCERIADRVDDLQHLTDTDIPFEDWLVAEAFLGCKHRQECGRFCEVAAKPTYESEGVAEDNGGSVQGTGDLRVGGPDNGADHCWVFAEIVLLSGGSNSDAAGPRMIEAGASRLRRLGWKKSAALLVLVMVSRGDVQADWDNLRARCDVVNQPLLTEPFFIDLPGRGAVIVRAFDVKRDPAYTLTMP